MERGSVSYKVYWFYLRSVGLPVMALVFLAYLLNVIFGAATNIWLSKWSADNVNPALNVSTETQVLHALGGNRDK